MQLDDKIQTISALAIYSPSPFSF